MKKLFVLVFAIALCLCALCFGASAHIIKPVEPTEGTGSPEDPYEIATVPHLYWFAEYVNEGNSGACAVLTQDILINRNVLTVDGDLNDLPYPPANEWIPINNFSGTFDGDGHTISGLYYSGSGNYVGLFGYVGSGGVVKDVSVADSYIGVTTTSENALYIGGISGHNEGHLEGCTFTGTLTAENNTTNNVYSYAGGISGSNIGTIERCINYGKITGDGYNPIVGGICGGDYNTEVRGTIKNCKNNGAVTSITIGGDGNTCVAGGILGDGLSRIEGCHNRGSVLGANYAGGIVGRSRGGTITDCTNSAEVMAYYQYAGGICGNALDTVSISECINSGSIEINDTSAKGFTGLGGICGGGSKPSMQISIVNCYNSGDLIGSQESPDDIMNIGGIFGRVSKSISHYIYIRNCCNAGTITCNSSIGEVEIGGVCGTTTSGGTNIQVLNVEHCFWLDRDGTGDEDTGAMTAERFERGEAAGSLNRWTYDEGTYNGKVWKVGEDGYPVLAGGSNDVVEVTFVDSNNNTLMTCCTNKGEKLKGIDSIVFDEGTTLKIGDNKVDDLQSMTFRNDTTIVVDGGLRYALTATVTGSARKAYDGSNAVTDARGLDLELSGIKTGDDVSVSSVKYVFDSAEAGKRNITVDSVTLAGEDADNYVLSATEVSGSVGTITKKTLTPSISGTVSKEYEGTTGVPAGHGLSIALDGAIDGESVSATATSYVYVDANVGQNKTINATGITLTGAAADNYVLSATTASGSVGTITKKTLTPSISGTVSKEYDGTTGVPAGHGLSIALDGAIDGESVSATAAYAFDDVNVGENKTITATGITLTGAAAGNYVLSPSSVSDEVGTITKKTLTPSFSGTVSKEYDGTTGVPDGHGLSIDLEDVVDGDKVSATAAYAFDDVNVGENKTINATGITLTGADAGNYVLSTTEVSGRVGAITLKKVTITAEDKSAYMGDAMPGLSYKVEGFLDGDELTAEPVLRCDADMTKAGTYEITVSGGAANSNYELSYKSGTLTVKLSWVMTVRPANGAADVVYYVHPGESFTLPDAPSKSGYYFVGWSDGNTTYKAGAMVENITADTTFTAVWREINIPTPNSITVTQPANGSIKVNPSNGSAGTLITVTATPDEGYELAYITVDGEKITGNTFRMPDKGVTVSAVFVPVSFPFVDVRTGDWFYDAVAYVYANGLMDGTSATTFEPNANMTRAMVWAILARIDGETVTGTNWLETARTWAMANGVSDGENANGYVTREQLATMLWRYAGSPAATGNGISVFTDAADVSDWAIGGLNWALEEGIVTGMSDGILAPQGTATRAQAAAMLMRFMEL